VGQRGLDRFSSYTETANQIGRPLARWQANGKSSDHRNNDTRDNSSSLDVGGGEGEERRHIRHASQMPT
jgi:hypothetical protein